MGEFKATSAEEARQELIEFSKKYGGKIVSIKSIKDIEIEAPLKVRIYKNHNHVSVPVLIFLHGGGWHSGDLETHDRLCRRLAAAGDVVVVAIDFRKAPESPYPIALEDSFKALEWIYKNVHRYGGNAFHLAIGGDSAGGNMAAALTMMARDRKGPRIGFQFLLFPITNLDTLQFKSYEDFSEGYWLRTKRIAESIDQYIPENEKRKEAYASPMLSSNLGQLPPGIVVTAEFDPLRDDAEEYVKRVNAIGGNLELVRYKGMLHDFVFSDFFPESEEVIQSIILKIGKQFAETK